MLEHRKGCPEATLPAFLFLALTTLLTRKDFLFAVVKMLLMLLGWFCYFVAAAEQLPEKKCKQDFVNCPQALVMYVWQTSLSQVGW